MLEWKHHPQPTIGDTAASVCQAKHICPSQFLFRWYAFELSGSRNAHCPMVVRNRYWKILQDSHVLFIVQSILWAWDPLDPLNLKSDETNLSNSVGDKNQLPVFISIGNRCLKIFQMHSMHSVIKVTPLQIRTKNCNIPQKWVNEHHQTNWEVQNEDLQGILQPLTFKQNSGARSGYYNVSGDDGNFRCCNSVGAVRLADYAENSTLHHLEWHSGICCECPKHWLGDYDTSKKQCPLRDHNKYWMLSDAETMTAYAKLLWGHVRWGDNVSQYIPHIFHVLPQPDLLPKLEIGMCVHLKKLMFHFMKMHEWLNNNNEIWLPLPPYHNLTLQNMAYKEVCQWNRKEMNRIRRYLFEVGTQSLQDGTPTQCSIFNRAIQCTQECLDFYMYSRYASHNNAKLSYMEDAYRRFPTFKSIFLLWWAGNKAKAKTYALRMELVKKRKVDKVTNPETWTLLNTQDEITPWLGYIIPKENSSMAVDTNVIHQTIHLISHRVEQMRSYGALQLHSAKRHEQVHETNLKDRRNASNHNLNYLPDVSTILLCIRGFEIRELNIQRLHPRLENRTGAWIVLCVVATRLSPQSDG